MNRRKAKKRKNNTYLLCSQYIYIKPSEWNRVKNKSKLIKRRFLMGKLDDDGMGKTLDLNHQEIRH